VALGSWGLDVLRADAELVVSELMSNAVMHAPGAASYQLVVTKSATSVRVAVSDQSPRAPVVRSPDDGRPGGKGLLIIEALAIRWGYELDGGGKQVWAELVIPSAVHTA
jgi:anti-sigma regulatory factor (Ser/Thr protein kinase)